MGTGRRKYRLRMDSNHRPRIAHDAPAGIGIEREQTLAFQRKVDKSKANQQRDCRREVHRIAWAAGARPLAFSAPRSNDTAKAPRAARIPISRLESPALRGQRQLGSEFRKPTFCFVNLQFCLRMSWRVWTRVPQWSGRATDENGQLRCSYAVFRCYEGECKLPGLP